MTDKRRPAPDVTPENKRYWEAAADGQLLLRSCRECGLTYHYPRTLCPDCLSDDTEWTEAAGTGTVYTYSVTERVREWPDDQLPVILAYVELEEGPRVMTNIVNCDPDDVTISAEVEVRFVSSEEDGIAVPVFTLV